MSSVAIIGGGPSGLTSAKAALENGLKPVVFEKAAQIGGLWKNKGGSTWDSMRTNISKYSCMFSDFPWPTNTPLFPSRDEFCAYFQNYAEKFDLKSHISLQSEVTHVRRSGDKWIVEWRLNGSSNVLEFDYLVVASGIFSKAVHPKIPGLETFAGLQIHAKDYKNPSLFKGKKVVVIGNSFSGSEIAVEVSQVAERVEHAVRHPIWVLPRELPNPKDTTKKLPLDFMFYSRSAALRAKDVPIDEANRRKNWWFGSMTEQAKRAPGFAPDAQSSEPPFVAISDAYLTQVDQERIQMKKEIDKIQDTQVHFSDSSVSEPNALIFCTGYQVDLHFLEGEVLNRLEFHPDDQLQPLLAHMTVFVEGIPNMALVGMYRGPFLTHMELQAKWACGVFSGRLPVPSVDEIRAGVKKERSIREQTPRPQFPHGDYVPFAEALAQKAGIALDLSKWQGDEKLHNQLLNGPFLSVSYQLDGPNAAMARQVLDEVNQL
jgi:dimethylaniline monooxygenase (N-oxide forming)